MRRQCTNTQPWRFRIGRNAIELYAEPRRKLRVDPAGREMLMSCGGALFGLRLAVRSLGHLPVVELLPDPARLQLLADRPDPVPDEIWDEAAWHYDEEELAALLLSIATTNVFNRLNAPTRQIAGAWG